MAIQKKGLLAAGIALLIVAAGGVVAAICLGNQNDSTTSPTVPETTMENMVDGHAPTTYQTLLSKYYTAILNDDSRTLYELMAPQAYWDYYMEHYGKTKEDIKESYHQMIAMKRSLWEQVCGEDVTVTFAITGMSEQSSSFLEEWTADMNQMLGEDAVHAEQALTLSVTQTIKGSTDVQETVVTPTIIQIDGQWYMLSEDNDSGQE